MYKIWGSTNHDKFRRLPNSFGKKRNKRINNDKTTGFVALHK
jgi:hypothetical protein